MAYGAKYRAECYTSREDIDIKVDILQDGYSSSVTDIDFAGDTPVVISQKPPDDPFVGQIIGSEARVRLMSPSLRYFSEFFNVTNREYQVKIYFDDVLVWAGYLVPDMYEEDYCDAPYEVELVATDGIGDLRNIDIVTTGEIDVDDIIMVWGAHLYDLAWDYLYDYTINSTNGLQETSGATDLESLSANTDRFHTDSYLESSSAYDIINEICKMLDARFIMDRGCWRMFRIPSLRSTSLTYRYYENISGYLGTGTENFQRQITNADQYNDNLLAFGSDLYDTFTTSGDSITSAINASGSATAVLSATLSVKTGERYNLKFNLALNSGQAPYFTIYKTDVGNISNSEQSAAGDNFITLTTTDTTSLAYFYVGNTAASNFSTGDILIYKDIHCFIGTPRLNIHPAARTLKMRQDYGYRNLLWKDGSFEYSDITGYWEALNSFSLSSSNRVGRNDLTLLTALVISEQLPRLPNKINNTPFTLTQPYAPQKTETTRIYTDNAGYCINMGSGYTTPANILSSDCVHYKATFDVQNTASANYAVKLKFDAKIEYTGGAAMRPGIFVRAYNASWDKWLVAGAGWSAGPLDVIADTDPTSGEWRTYEVYSDELTTSYEVAIHVYLSTMCYSATTPDTSTATYFDNIELYIVRIDEELALDTETELTLDEDHNLEFDPGDKLLGDVDEEGYEDTLYQGYLKNSGTLTTEWQFAGVSGMDTLFNHSADWQTVARENPLQKIVGTFYGRNNFMTVYKDTGNTYTDPISGASTARIFFTNYASWDLQEMMWTGEFIEIPPMRAGDDELLTQWSNDTWDTWSVSGGYIDCTATQAGRESFSTSSISYSAGEVFCIYVEWESATYPESLLTWNDATIDFSTLSGIEAGSGVWTEVTPDASHDGSADVVLTSVNDEGNDEYENLLIQVRKKIGY